MRVLLLLAAAAALARGSGSGSGSGSEGAACGRASSLGAEGFNCMAEIDDGVELHWRLDGDELDMLCLLQTEGWAGVGWSSTGRMPGSDVVLKSEDRELGPNHIDTYAGPEPDASQSLLSVSAAVADGVTRVAFRRALDNGGAVPLAEGRNVFVYAMGASEGDAVVDSHSASRQGAVWLDLLTGETEAVRNEDALTHGALMLAAWGALLPAGALAMRAGWGLRAHAGLQAAGLAVATGGAALALATQGPFNTAHGWLGAAAMALAWLQPLNAALRPPREPRGARRRWWERLHKGGGAAALALGLGAMLGGLQELRAEPGLSDAVLAPLVFASAPAFAAALLLVAARLRARAPRTHPTRRPDGQK